MGLLLPALVGVATGFVVCIPPGPINITILRAASLRRLRYALLVAVGGALADAAISMAAATGVHYLVASALDNAWVRFGFSVFLIGYGLGILTMDRLRRGRPPESPPARAGGAHGPIGLGLLQGLSNPALVGNWMAVVAFLSAQGLLGSSAAELSALAIGVGVGGFLWYGVLVWGLHALRDHPVGAGVRESVVLAGVLMIAFGLYFGARAWIGMQ